METKQFVLLDIDYITKNRIPVIRLFGKLIGENGGGSKIIALDRTFRPYIYIHPYNVDECIKELGLLELEVEKIRRKDKGKLKDFLKVTLKHPHDIYKLKDKILDLKSVKKLENMIYLFTADIS